jgi:hypothetical protein
MYAGMLELRALFPISERARTTKDASERKNGAQGRNRTTDTAIFSRMLYQLSYLGVSERPKGLSSGRFIVAPDRDVHPASRAPRRRAQPFFAVRHSRTQPSPRVWPPARRCVQNIGESTLFRVLDVVVAAGDDVGTGQPTVEVDVAAARRAEWPRLLRRRPAADRAARARFRGLGGLFARFVRHQGDGLLGGLEQ